MKAGEAIIYLNQAQKLGIIPNFWLCLQYLQFQKKARLVKNSLAMWIEEEGKLLFPPLPTQKPLGNTKGFPTNVPIWSDFSNYSVGEPIEFLDYEYSYYSTDFQNLSGGKWSVFRKNIRKWPNKNPNSKYTMKPPRDEEIHDFFIRWLEARPDMEIHDPDTMIQYITKGNCRAFLYRDSGELVGINIFDIYDAKHVIYRYCIVAPNEPFLDEFLRYQFYSWIPHRIVIDGGTLGSVGLERFKDRLNPFRKRMIFTRK